MSSTIEQVAPVVARAPLASVQIRAFRSSADVSLSPGPLTALVGDAPARGRDE